MAIGTKSGLSGLSEDLQRGPRGLVGVYPGSFGDLVPRLSVDRMLRMRTEWEPPMRGSKMFETQLRTNYP